MNKEDLKVGDLIEVTATPEDYNFFGVGAGGKVVEVVKAEGKNVIKVKFNYGRYRRYGLSYISENRELLYEENVWYISVSGVEVKCINHSKINPQPVFKRGRKILLGGHHV